jgi:hypothetical protein
MLQSVLQVKPLPKMLHSVHIRFKMSLKAITYCRILNQWKGYLRKP